MLDPTRLFFRAHHRPWCTVFDSRSSFPLNRATNTRAMATSTSALTGADMLAMQRWAVVGDALNEQKPAFQIAEKLLAAGKEVHVVNPRETAGRCFTSLKDCPQPIDVVDLVISPKLGPGIIDDMAALGIGCVFVQPGAGSDEVQQRARASGISVHHGCVLIEL